MSNIEKRIKSHLSFLKQGKHHNIYLQRAFNKYGEEAFIFTFKEKEFNDIKSMHLLEERYINFCWKSGKLYNVSKKASGGDLISYHPLNKEFRKMQSILVRERHANMSDDEKKKRSEKLKGEKNPNYGNRWSEEQKEHLSLIAKDRYEQGKCVIAIKGKTFEEAYGIDKAKEMKEKISKRSKLYVGEKNPFFGKHHSDETKEKIREKHKGIKPLNCKKVKYNGVIYESATECARQLGMKNVTVSYRAKNNIYGFSYVGENDELPQREASLKWSKESCEEIAKTCKTKKEFMEKDYRAYSFSKRNNLLQYFAEIYFDEIRHRWTLDEILEVAKKYNNYSEFRQNEIKAYSIINNHKDWMKEVKKYFNCY